MKPSRPERKVLDHGIPPWAVSDSFPELFFMTICCRPRGHQHLTSKPVWDQLLETILHRNLNGTWKCSLLLAMPDHLHALMSFEGAKKMTATIKDWKRWTARTLSISWQDGFFDHRIRDESSLLEKRTYILDNPIRAKLVETREDWPYQWQAD